MPAHDANRREAAPAIVSWSAVGVFTLFYALAYIDRRILSFLVGPIRETLGVSDFQLSILQGAAFVLFYALFSLPIGWAVDRFPRRWIIYLGVTIWSFSAMAGGFAKTYLHLLFARFGVGAGEAALHPAANSMLADFFLKGRLTLALGVYSLGGIAGAAIAVAVGGVIIDFATARGATAIPLLGTFQPWQLVLLLTGAPGLLLALFVFAVPEPARTGVGPAHAAPIDKNAYAYVWRHRRFYLCHFVGFALMAVMATGFTAWGPERLMRSFQVSATEVGLTLGALMFICGGIGMIVPSFVVDRLARRGVGDAHLRYMALAAIVLGGAGILFGLAPTRQLAYAAAGLVDLLQGYFPVALAALAVTTPARYRGQITAMFLLVYNLLGQGLGPSAVAALTDFVFHDEQALGAALAVQYAVLTPVVVACFAWGRGGMQATHDEEHAG